jgi:prepilin-type N-terminal cleavage/methylation domain-containing protein
MRATRHTGFTLIEMLIVIAIVLMLAALLLPAVAMVRKHAKVAAARTEVKQIEAAWRQYYSEYEKWPPMLTYTSDFVRIQGAVGALLTRGEADAANNPRRLRFLEFKRLNASGSPVTPWADTDLTDAEMDDAAGKDRFYYSMFDMDYNNIIPGSPSTPVSVESPLTNNVQRTVVAWTVNPDLEPDDPNYIIGSWQ